MRELSVQDAEDAVLGGGVFASGGGGWAHHGKLMGQVATSVGTPRLATVAELPDDTWVATVTAIGAPAAKTWEIQPLDYVRALKALMQRAKHPITAVMTAQNGYSTTLNGWIQSAVLDVLVLDAAGDVRAHPTGKLGAMQLTEREAYQSIQSVAGGNRTLHGYFEAVVEGTVVTCDDVLRDISVRTGGFIASARNPVELSWVKENAALGAISLAIDLGAQMRAARPGGAPAVLSALQDRTGAEVVAQGPIRHADPVRTSGGFDHGTIAVDDSEVPYLNEFLAVTVAGNRVATYPDTIALVSTADGLPVAVKDAQEGEEVWVVVIPAERLPRSSSACDVGALREVEDIRGVPLTPYLTSGPVEPVG